MDHKSECSERPFIYRDEVSSLSDNGEKGCWYPKTFKKAIVVVVDALRYDFTIPYVPHTGPEDVQHYHNQFPILHETASKSPQHAVLRPFIADPPTTTLQRLKGLTTGTLPTFIDAGSNFAGTSIDEDNLLYQLKAAGKRIVHLGDDTWHALFPGYFEEDLTHPFDSFNVWDLHTVDTGVNEHLFPLLKGSNSTKWDVIFAHFLGVDHAGHRYGPNHPAMAAKLRQMDDVFRELISSIDDTTLLVVLGDHGMDSKGDHGGESDDEVEAAIWMYSKQAIFGRRSPLHAKPPKSAKERPIAQIDLVPTLALLLGLPIPFNNLGAPIEEAFVGPSGDDVKNLAMAYQITAAQINRYQSEYAKVQKTDESINEGAKAAWETAMVNWASFQKLKKLTRSDWEIALKDFQLYQQKNISMCRALWAQFDISSMVYGIMILACGLPILIMIANDRNEDKMQKNSLYVKSAIAGSVVGYLSGEVLQIPRAFAVGIGAELCFLVVSVSHTAPLSLSLPKSLWSWISISFPLLLSIGFASNSFTIWEDEILLFFLATIGFLLLACSLRVKKRVGGTIATYNAIIFLFLLRLSSLSRLCREEQIPYCRSTYYASASSSTSASWQLLISFNSALLLPEIVKFYYKSTGANDNAVSRWFNIYFRAGLALTAFYWTTQTADDNSWLSIDGDILRTFGLVLAKTVLFIAFGQGYYLLFQVRVSQGLSSHLQDENNTETPGKPVGNGTSNDLRSVTVDRNHHGSQYFAQVSIWVLLVILVEKPMGGGAIAMLCWQILCLLEILSACDLAGSDDLLNDILVRNIDKDNTEIESMESSEASKYTNGARSSSEEQQQRKNLCHTTSRKAPSFIGPTTFGMLGSFHFFKTGHQTTLASIQWESAFVPFRTIHYPWSPLLVVLNTFGAQIICAIAVPMIPLWRKHVQPQQEEQKRRRQQQKEEQDKQHYYSILKDIATCLATHILFYSVVNLATVMWAGWLRRHLMLFRIFSPRFMTGAMVLLVVDVVGIFVGLGTVWVVLRKQRPASGGS